LRGARRVGIEGVEEPRTDSDAADPRSRDASSSLIRVPSTPSGLDAYRRAAAWVLLADVLSIVGAILVVHRWVTGSFSPSRDVVAVLVVAPVLWIAVFHSFGLYGIRHLSAPEEFRRLLSATTLGAAVILVGSFWWEEALHRQTLVLTWGVALLLELVVRRVTRWHLRREKRLGRLSLRTMIVGGGEEAAAIARALGGGGTGFTPLGSISPRQAGASHLDLPLLGGIDDIIETIERFAVECVFVASTELPPTDVYRISHACRVANIEMRVSANAPEVLTSRISVQQIRDLMVLSVRPGRLTGPQAALKRTFDVSLASLALFVFSPLFGLIALAIKLTSRGPVFFRQERVTRDGHPFTMIKFRTMVVDPERALQGAVIDLTKPYFKMSDDPRLTRFGRTLRSLSLDELPQFWNVLRGDMSLVGPRPLPIEQVNANVELLQPRHEVRAGVTGWWQVSGRSQVDVDAALKMDLFYIENWSLSLDVYILLKTLGAVLARRGAY
jgi:exopolysaccharide biosynthesis polyprenyl glycosylphosphotransferase